MKTAPIPPQEKERLATLRALRILDTAPEERFDRITRLLLRLLDVPIAILSLVDEHRQWFKSRQGVETAETPRDIAFCAHAILGRKVFLVEDARNDERFKDNPLVERDPNIRFYAGYPVSGPGGFKVGALCAIDRKPRRMSGAELELLAGLGLVAEEELLRTRGSVEDQVTGLADERFFHSLLQHVMTFSKRTGIPLSLLMARASSTQDRLLLEAARLLGESVRESDIIGRTKDGVFFGFFPKCSRSDAARITSRIEENLTIRKSRGSLPQDFRLLCGSVSWDGQSGESLEDLFERGRRAIMDTDPKSIS